MDESLAAQVANLQNVKWLDYTTNLMQTQKILFESNTMSDVLIVVGPAQYKAHQVILTVCSDFFAEIFSTSNITNSVPTILIPDLNQNLMPLLLEFMYTGEVFVSSNYLSEFLEACRFLQIKGFVSYDCMVNGIRLQPEPSTNDCQTIVPETISEDPKPAMIILPHTYDISDVVVNTDYPTKEFSISEDVAVEFNKCIETQSNTSVIETTGVDTTMEEYLEEDEDPLLDTSVADNPVTFLQPKTESTSCPEEVLPSSFRPSKYTEEQLNEAIDELKSGSTVADVAAKFDIPRSTIYSKLRHSKDPVYRSYRLSHLQEAAQCVTETGISLKEASEKFDVSKTVLWRTLKKSSYYKPEERAHASRSEALVAIQNGDTLVSISKRFNIPLATLHRDKVRLHNEGKLPEHCKLTRRDSGTNYRNRLRAAVQSCIGGMPQKMAAELHKVAKTTIWRHVQQASRSGRNITDEMFEYKEVDEDDENDQEEADKMDDETMVDGEVEEQLEEMVDDELDEDEDDPEFVLPYNMDETDDGSNGFENE